MTKQAKFDITKFVKYNEETKRSACLFKGCERQLSGKKPSDIKRHYVRIHKIDCETESLGSSKKDSQTNKTKPVDTKQQEDDSPSGAQHDSQTPNSKEIIMAEEKFDLNKYVKYIKRTNKSICLVCKTVITGKRPWDIKRHYRTRHMNSAPFSTKKTTKATKSEKIESSVTNNHDDETPRSSKTKSQTAKKEMQTPKRKIQTPKKEIPTLKKKIQTPEKEIQTTNNEIETSKKETETSKPVIQMSQEKTQTSNTRQKATTFATSKLKKLVKFDKPTNTYSCLVKTCKSKWRRKSASLFRRHYERFHKINCDNGASIRSRTKPPSNPVLSTVTTTLNRHEFLTNCMDLLKDGFPLSLFEEGSSFKKLLQPLEDLFETNLTPATLKIMMENDENQLKEKTAEFKHVTADDMEEMICD